MYFQCLYLYGIIYSLVTVPEIAWNIYFARLLTILTVHKVPYYYSLINICVSRYFLYQFLISSETNEFLTAAFLLLRDLTSRAADRLESLIVFTIPEMFLRMLINLCTK